MTMTLADTLTKMLPVALAAAALAAGWSAAQQDGADIENLLRAKGCHACHALSEPLLGPPYQAIALQNAGNAEAAVALADKILHGGAGAWGVVPMPRNDRVSEEEARVIVAWILEQTPE
jgi:cytochrome c